MVDGFLFVGIILALKNLIMSEVYNPSLTEDGDNSSKKFPVVGGLSTLALTLALATQLIPKPHPHPDTAPDYENTPTAEDCIEKPNEASTLREACRASLLFICNGIRAELTAKPLLRANPMHVNACLHVSSPSASCEDMCGAVTTILIDKVIKTIENP